MRHFMKTVPIRTLVTFIICTFSLLSCKKNYDEEMKNEVVKYFETVKNDDLESNKFLFSDNDADFSGLAPANFHFIKNNYDRIKPDSLIKKINIEDSYNLSPEIKIKKIEFSIPAENDSLNLIKPLIISFEFPVPYKKNAMKLWLHNQFEWRDNKSSFKTQK